MPKLFAATLLCFLLVATSQAADPPAQTTRPPNFVVIFIDDMGYGDIGPFGATKQKTARLDRMAKEGMKLTSFYAAPVCSVSRAQMMTGCYGARVSVPGVFGPAHATALNLAEVTIAERLKELGYATMCVGKWHLGDAPEYLPTKQGFDHYLGLPYSNDMQRKSAQTGELVVPLVRDDSVLELLDGKGQEQIVERYTAAAVEFIRAQKDKPFFLYLPHTAMHVPLHPSEKFAGKSQNGRFGDWVEELDASTGLILDTLQELKLDDNTLVLFTSDNGPWLEKGADGGSAGPLRAGKGTTWEGGVRVPTLARWPGKIAPGSVCDAVAGTIDVLPTLVTLAGGAVPAEPVIDGRDISPLLLGKSTTSPREVHYYFSNYTLQGVRQGPWKLRFHLGDKQTQLYNLETDIGEQTNVAAAHPEVVAKLQALADKMEAEIGADVPTARRPPGRVANPKLLYSGNPSKTPPGPAKAKPAKNAPTEGEKKP